MRQPEQSLAPQSMCGTMGLVRWIRAGLECTCEHLRGRDSFGPPVVFHEMSLPTDVEKSKSQGRAFGEGTSREKPAARPRPFTKFPSLAKMKMRVFKGVL